jgi:hypothetical protein
MDDGEKNKNLEKELPRKSITSISNVGTIFQSFWIRCRSIFPIVTDRKFMESELRFVLYCGGLLWVLFLLSQII